MRSSSIEHRSSVLLSPEENDQVFRLLGHRCQSLATAVVQLFLTQGPDHSAWIKRDTGAMCFVKDNPRKSYFFRLYCPSRRILVWEQEVYNNIEYKAPLPYLHTFEAEESMAAFNFANEEEALVLKNVLFEKLEARRQRREERRSRSSMQSNRSGSMPPKQHSASQSQSSNAGTWSNTMANGTVHPRHHRSNSAGGQSSTSGRNGNSKKRRHLTKADIGLPLDFKHVSHVGWDPHKGFDIDGLEGGDENLKEFFTKAGVSERQLQDRETRQFIYDFISKHGGLDAVKEEVGPTRSTPPRSQPPPVPARVPNASSSRQAPPPPPSRTTNRAPPPPINSRTPPARPPELPSVIQSAVPPPPPPPPIINAPPPPPPPPVGGFTALNVGDNSANMTNEGPSERRNPSASGGGAAPDPRSAMLDRINRGEFNLKHVEVERRPSGNDQRGNLLDEIRQGIELRPVPNQKPAADNSEPQTGLAGALARALAERSKALHSDSDTSDTNSDDEEWED